MLDPLVSKEQEINIAVTAIETAVLKAAIAATDLKRGLKAHLYDLEGYAGPRRCAASFLLLLFHISSHHDRMLQWFVQVSFVPHTSVEA